MTLISWSGVVHIVIGTAATVHDLIAAEALLHGAERGSRGSLACRDAPRQAKATGSEDRLDAIYDQVERLKAGIRAKVEHPFRVIKQQFGYTKRRYRGLMKNTAWTTTQFSLCNLWMVRKAMRIARNSC